MKKQLIVLFTLVTISLISFTSCEPFIENKIVIRNMADGDISLNIKAHLYDVPAGTELIINDFDRGVYEYETLYTIPYAVTNFNAEGDVAGEMNFIGGTEIFLLYSSTLTISTSGTSTNSTYTVYGSMTSSDSKDRVDPFAIGGTP